MTEVTEKMAALSLRNPGQNQKAPEQKDWSTASLAEQFHQAQLMHQKKETTSLASADTKYQANVKAGCDLFQRVWARMNAEQLLSSNETLDDISTTTLKYLLTPYYLGDFTLAFSGVEGRLGRLTKSIDYLNAFLEYCSQFGLLSAEEIKMFEHPTRRVDRKAKIDQHKRDQALQQQLEAVMRLRERGRKRGRELTDEVDEEDNERDYLLLLIRSHITPALKHIAQSNQEIPFLEMMEKRTKEREAMGLRGRGPPEKPINTVKPFMHKIENPQQLTQPLPAHLQGKFSLMPAQQTITANNVQATSVQGLIDSRKNPRATVFRDSNPWTETVEEWAEEEIRRGNLPGPPPKHSHGQNRQNFIRAAQPEPEDEDDMKERLMDEDEDMHDYATVKDRYWKDWTDDNEKGIGQRATSHYSNPADRRADRERLSGKPDLNALNSKLARKPPGPGAI